MRILVTGGCGFIGSNLIFRLLTKTEHEILNIDKLTYAATIRNHKEFLYNPRYRFEKTDINDINKVKTIFYSYKPDAVIHLAAESHVDRSIANASEFIGSNFNGTYCLLEVARQYCEISNCWDRFRFLYVNTDEVFGSLGFDDKPFTEKHQYQPSSPYSASKAAAHMLVMAWLTTYKIPTITTFCSNNYGRQQLPEKLIPHTIFRALDRRSIPVYGDGKNVRDWIHVDDHCDALMTVLEKGKVGESYCIGSDNEWANIDLVVKICETVDRLMLHKESTTGGPRKELIQFVEDRKGHDRRYALDCTKLKTELGWEPKVPFEKGLEQTVVWYLAHREWWL